MDREAHLVDEQAWLSQASLRTTFTRRALLLLNHAREPQATVGTILFKQAIRLMVP